MGHFHAENLSRKMLSLLYEEVYAEGRDKYGEVNCLGNKRKRIRPITTEEFSNYFTMRLNSCNKILNNYPDSLFGKKILKELAEREYSFNASDGSFPEMINEGVNIILNIWQDEKFWGIKIITPIRKGSKKGYILSKSVLLKLHKENKKFEDFVVKEVDI